MRFKQFLEEATLKGVINPDKVFSDLEQNVLFTLLVDFPHLVTELDGFKEKKIPTANLIPTQAKIEGYKVDNDDPLLVVERDAKFYVIDGHHRLGRNRKEKVAMTKCFVLSLPSERINDLDWFIKKFGSHLTMTKDGIVRLG